MDTETDKSKDQPEQTIEQTDAYKSDVINDVALETENSENTVTQTKPDVKIKSDKKSSAKQITVDVFVAIVAGLIVSVAYYFFQNSNGFAPGGVGGLATITYHLTGYKIEWGLLMIAYNLPILVLLSIFVSKRLGIILIIYIVTQSAGNILLNIIGATPYTEATSGDDFNIIFASLATGVISGIGFSIALKRFGASGGTYAISAIIKRFKPATNIAYVSFLLDGSIVIVSFFVYGMKLTPVICTFLNLFVANVVVDHVLSGVKNGFRFEIVTTHPEELSKEIMDQLGHGVTEINGTGMYSHSEKAILVCIVRKRQLGKFMKIIQRYPDTFASFSKVNEVFGRFKQ